MENKLTQERLKELLHYDPDTGNFTWLVTNSPRALKGSKAGYIDSNGYNSIRINTRLYNAARLAWLYVEGYFPENDVGYINRVKHDCRWANLRHSMRYCTSRNNKMNKNNTSGITGVTSKNGKWWVQMTIKSKRHNLGLFTDLIDAAKERWKYEIKYNYPNCRTTSTAYQYLKEHGVIEC
jgi:hypothetical protein